MKQGVIFPSIRKKPKIIPTHRSWIPGLVVRLEIDPNQEFLSKDHNPFPHME